MRMEILFLFFTLLAASLGAFIFIKLKLPAGAFLGAMIFVAVFNVLSDIAFIPADARLFIRIFAGAQIGSRMTKSNIIQIKTIVFPVVLLVFGMLVLNFSLGYGIHKLTGMELITALLGSAPGGIQDMSLIADDLGADAAQIALLQTVRVFAVIGIHPVVLRALLKRYRRPNPDFNVKMAKGAGPGSSAETPKPQSKKTFREVLKIDAFRLARTILFAAIGGFLLNMTPLPAGAMVGAMLATVLSTLLIAPAYVPQKVRIGIMVCAGALIGSGVGAAELISLRTIIIPSCILVIVLLTANIIFGFLIHKITKLDLATSLFASAAGGVMDMALIADEMGADAPKVAVMQLLRLISVIALFPSAIKFLSTII